MALRERVGREASPSAAVLTGTGLRCPDNARVALAVIVNLEQWDWELPEDTRWRPPRGHGAVPQRRTWSGDRESISASAGEDWFVVDSPLEGAVTSELVSGPRIPC